MLYWRRGFPARAGGRGGGARFRALAAGALLLGALLGGPAHPGAAGAPGGGGGSAEGIVARLQEKYDETGTLRADFVQENELRSLGRTTRSRGVILLSKPGRIRVEYHEPESQLIVSDGSRLWIYTARLKQVILNDLNGGGAASAPLLFLAGKGKLSENFRVVVEETGIPKRTEGVWRGGHPHRLSLEPLRPGAGFRRMWLEVEPESYLISGLEYVDSLGNRSRMRFSNIREGVEVPPDAFEFKVPPGVEVIRPPSRSGPGR